MHSYVTQLPSLQRCNAATNVCVRKRRAQVKCSSPSDNDVSIIFNNKNRDGAKGWRAYIIFFLFFFPKCETSLMMAMDGTGARYEGVRETTISMEIKVHFGERETPRALHVCMFQNACNILPIFIRFAELRCDTKCCRQQRWHARTHLKLFADQERERTKQENVRDRFPMKLYPFF